MLNRAADGLGDLVHRSFLFGPDIQGDVPTGRQVGGRGQNVRFHHVGHVRIGSRLFSVAEHGERVAILSHPQESRNHQSVLTL